MEITGKTEGDAAKIIAAFMHNGLLIDGDYVSPKTRKAVKRITLNEAKVAETVPPPARVDLDDWQLRLRSLLPKRAWPGARNAEVAQGA